MRECIKAFANIIAADFGMKLLIRRNSQSWWKQVLTTDEICLSIDISDWQSFTSFINKKNFGRGVYCYNKNCYKIKLNETKQTQSKANYII